MMVIGRKYKFTSVDIEKLKEKYKIKEIVYLDTFDLSTIKKNLSENNFKYVILNSCKKSSDELVKYLTSLRFKGVKFLTVEQFLEEYLGKLYIGEDLDFLEEIKPFSKFQHILKRVIDFSISVPLLILTSPVMLYSIYRIKKESPDGPVIFEQKRVGLNAKEFICYKFRSMIPDAEKGKPQFASKDDPRVFKWGAFMRKTRIDELPQLWNVIKGDMHLIGPRPERKYWVDIFEEKIPYYNLRHVVKPGITGWAQVNYPYGANEEDTYQKLMYDLYYIKNWSILLEFKTIFKTVWVMVGRKGL